MTFSLVLANSGLSKGELASLYGVSRQTIYCWKDGVLPRANTTLARQAEVITAALVNSIGLKILPLGAMASGARKARIASMAKTLQSLKLAPIK